MNRILISIMDGLRAPDWLKRAEDYLKLVSSRLNYDNEEISVLFCNDEYIRELNKNYRNIDAPTDVLSFENDEEYEDEEGKWKCAGDIAVSLDMLKVNAEYFDIDVNTELKRLLLHGLLHLNGMDHGEEHIEAGKEPECEMLKLQEKLLDEFKDEKIII